MDKLINRYIYDVTRRLPEKEGAEVSKELESNIYDMLPENANEEEIKKILYEMGHPSLLAEKYRQKPQYLISPEIYNDYIHVLKWVLPLVGSSFFVIGGVLGGIETIGYEIIDISTSIQNILLEGISLGISATFQALICTTIGFVIAERIGNKIKNKEQGWKIEDLPEVSPNNIGKIPLFDSITELVLILVFLLLIILTYTGILPITVTIQNNSMQIFNLFNHDFLASFIPAIIFMGLFNAFNSIVKIKQRKWTTFVCATSVIDSLIGIVIWIYLITRHTFFSDEFRDFLQSIDRDSDFLYSIINTSTIFTCLVIIVISLSECCMAIYKTYKSRRHL